MNIEKAAKDFYEASYGDYPSGFVMEASIQSFKAGVEWAKEHYKTENWDTTPRNQEVSDGIGPIGII